MKGYGFKELNLQYFLFHPLFNNIFLVLQCASLPLAPKRFPQKKWINFLYPAGAAPANVFLPHQQRAKQKMNIQPLMETSRCVYACTFSIRRRGSIFQRRRRRRDERRKAICLFHLMRESACRREMRRERRECVCRAGNIENRFPPSAEITFYLFSSPRAILEQRKKDQEEERERERSV